MGKYTLFFLLQIFILLSTKIQAQKETDRLFQKSYDELLTIYKKNITEDTISSLKIIDVYLKKAKLNKDTLHIANAYKYHYLISDEKERHYLDSIITITKYNQSKEYPAFAYIKKAKLNFRERDTEKTLFYLNLARKYAKANDNIILLYRIDYFIGIVRSEHLGEKEKALNIFKRCARFFSKGIKEDHKFRYLYTLHAIAELNISLEKNDSATYYNRLGYAKASKSTIPAITKTLTYFTICEGINEYKRKKYTAAIDSINKALPKLIKLNDKSNIIDGYFYLGKSYRGLENTEKAIIYFKKTDSILETLNSPPQYKHLKTYEVLKEYYKSNKDLHNQNKYLNKLNSYLDHYVNDKIFIGKKIKEDYDIPILIEEQKNIIQKLNKDASNYTSKIQLLSFVLLILGGLLFYQYRKKRLYRSRFNKLIEEKVQPTNKNITTKVSKNNQSILSDQKINVPEKHVTYILNKLSEFEQNKKYLALGVSVQSLADEIETNVKYLSRVINYHKNKTFTHYLNELRIMYAVEELKQNNTLRKYTIKAIATEMGYKSPETFSNAFYKQIGIKPSYYIKNLNKLELESD